jgi:hypothetical protein
VTWLVSSPFQKIFGRIVDQTGSFDTGLEIAGCAPAVAVAILLACWPAEQWHRGLFHGQLESPAESHSRDRSLP